MKITIKKLFKILIVGIVILSLTQSCNKEFEYTGTSLVAVETIAFGNVLQTSATISGRVNTDNGSNLFARGICYDTLQNPTINKYVKRDVSATIGNFTCTIESLFAGHTYYAKAYATNSFGTAYGTQLSFITKPGTIPIISSKTTVDSITATTAKSGGIITSSGGVPITARGVCWSSTNSNPTIVNSSSKDGTGIGSYASILTGLTPNTTFYVRAYATNSVGTAYGNIIIFKTLSNLFVGQMYQGGVIAYIFQSGDVGYISGETHGIIAATSDQSYGATWGCSGTLITTYTVIGAGQSNTTAIINNCFSTNIAASICNNLSLGGYTDWYLPSSDELLKAYQNVSAIGGFSNAYYLSSSQYTSTNALAVYFGSGGLYSLSKASSYYVRAIRNF